MHNPSSIPGHCMCQWKSNTTVDVLPCSRLSFREGKETKLSLKLSMKSTFFKLQILSFMKASFSNAGFHTNSQGVGGLCLNELSTDMKPNGSKIPYHIEYEDVVKEPTFMTNNKRRCVTSDTFCHCIVRRPSEQMFSTAYKSCYPSPAIVKYKIFET